MTFRTLSKESGFTLIEILMTIGLVAIMSTVGISLMSGSVDEGRYDATMEEMRSIRSALIGDTSAKQGGARVNFGYLGDVGRLPSAAQGLSALLSRPSGISAWAVNNSARFGLGWNGPYLSSSSNGQDPLTDAWGRAYTYAPGPPATVTSLGADGAAGGTGYNQDAVISLTADQMTATVYGFVSSGGSPYAGAAQAEIFFPNGTGGLASTLVSVAAGGVGAFQFTNIPFGARSLSIYFPTKAAPTQTIGPILFTVDKPKFLVPVTLSDRDPGNSGLGNGGGNLSGITCNTPANRLTLNGTASSSADRFVYNVRTTQSINISKISVAIPGSNQTFTRALFNGNDYACSGGRTITPCPAALATAATLNSAFTLTNNGNFEIVFSTQVASVNNATVTIQYDSGCDILQLTNML